MQTFVETNREDPAKEDVNRRIRTFEEIYRFFSDRKVARQAERCVQCGDPFCTTIGCPLGNYIPQWLEAIAEKDLEKAFLLSNESSPFPEILGRICPHKSPLRRGLHPGGRLRGDQHRSDRGLDQRSGFCRGP